MAAVAHDIYIGEQGWFPEASPWYQPHVDYALECGIIYEGEFGDYTAYATRAQMAAIFARALPESALAAVRTVTTLPDVSIDRGYGPEIFRLYRAGVLSGDDIYGTFRPNDNISRAEAAAIITRECVPSRRESAAIEAPAITVSNYCNLSGTTTDSWPTSYHFRLPQINGGGEYAGQVNSAIRDIYSKYVVPEIQNTNKGYSAVYESMDYSYRFSNGVLSLVLTTKYCANDYVTYKTWLLDGSGNEITGPGLIALHGVSESTFNRTVKGLIADFASNDFNSSDPSVYNKSIASSNYGTWMPMYITERGTIAVVVKIYQLAGAGFSWYLFDTGL